METTVGLPAEQQIPRRRPIERPIGWEGFWARFGLLFTTAINVTVFFLLWEYIAQQRVVSRLLLPPVSDIVRETMEMARNGQLVYHLSFSATNFTIGFLLATVTGIPLGLLLGASQVLDRILGPYIWALFSTPRLALLPLITVAMGFGMASKVTLIFLGAFFVIVINTWAGVKTVEPGLIRAARVFGATRFQVFTKVVVPYTLPFIAVGLRLGITRALITTLVAEMIASSRGLGYVVIRALDAFNSARMWSMILLLVFISLSLVLFMRKLEAWVAPWRETTSF